VILESPETAIYRSVSEIADAASTSTATVVRCAQAAGFRGFHDLKLALARELTSVAVMQADATGAGPAEDVVTDVLESGVRTLREVAGLLDRDAFAAAVSRLSAAHRVLFAGVGTSGTLAQDAAHRFTAIGLTADAPVDVLAQHLVARALTARDVCLAVSHTGSTRETLAAVAAAAAAGATTIAITSYLRSPLTEMVDITLLAGAREVSFRLEGVASRLAHMAVLDALLLATVQQNERRAREALDRYADMLADHRL
jgi:DNA-binding MurR/RpiR family transcriptional regulator